MKKQVLFFVLCALFAFPHSARCEGQLHRALFVTVIQEPSVLSSREEITKLVDFAKRARIKILFVQVYRANQSWFPSKVADPSPYEACVKALSEDPLALLIKETHAAGIEVHAWLNLLSLSQNKDAPLLKKYGAGILTKNTLRKRRLEDYRIDNQYFLEPGDPAVRKELSEVVKELLNAYPALDGILFDYIRYPDKNPAYGYTEANIARFKKATGCGKIEETSPAWQDWKRAQVTELLEGLVEKTRALRPNIQVASTGCAPYIRAYYEAFQDWPSWLDRGLVDFVAFMSYSQDTAQFSRWIADARKRTADFSKVDIAIGAYKEVGSAGTFARQYELCRQAGPGACAIFHYGSLLEDPALSSFLTKK
jgi:uncharacterized lipoprotein YddW (UPF0748 family)